MNYIKQLQEIRDSQSATLNALSTEIIDFMVHLSSSKFHNDTTIQVADVLRFTERLFDIKRGV